MYRTVSHTVRAENTSMEKQRRCIIVVRTVKYVDGDGGRSDIRQGTAVVSAVFLVGIGDVQP